MAVLFCATAFFGSFIGIMIGKSIDAPPQSINRLSLSFLFAAQLIAIALCLPLAITKLTDTLPKLSMAIPFKQQYVSFIRAFPCLTALGLSLIGIAWPAASIGSALGLTPIATLGMLVIGSISGGGIVCAILWLPKYKGFLLALAFICSEFFLVRAINQTSSSLGYIIAFGILVDSTISGIPFCMKQVAHHSWYRNTKWVSWHFSHHLWWIAKVWRNQRTKIGFITVIMASCLTAAFAIHVQALQLGFITPVLTLLAASFACDLRPLAPLQRPFEISGLRGYWYFVKTIAWNGFIVCLIGLAPLLVTFMVTLPSIQEAMVLYVSILFGYSVGLWVSFLLVPQSRNPLGQVLAVGLASVLLFTSSKLPFIVDASLLTRIIAYSSLAIAALAHCSIIEYKRNSFLWRRQHVQEYAK